MGREGDQGGILHFGRHLLCRTMPDASASFAQALHAWHLFSAGEPSLKALMGYAHHLNLLTCEAALLVEGHIALPRSPRSPCSSQLGLAEVHERLDDPAQTGRPSRFSIRHCTSMVS